MKIALIELSTPSTQALGVRCLSAYLKKAGHTVEIIFLIDAGMRESSGIYLYPEYVLKQTVDLCQDTAIIGLSFLTPCYHRAVQLTDRLKTGVKAPVVWGGIYATAKTERCLQHVDIVCRGEGEEAFLELISRFENQQKYDDVQNFWFNRDGKIIKNTQRPLIQDMNSLPFMDYDPASHHFVLDEENEEIRPLDKALYRKLTTFGPANDIMVNKTVYTTMASRGCPHRCTYCFNSFYQQIYPKQKYLRRRSADSVMAELCDVMKSYDFIDVIWFADDCLTAATDEHIREFCEKYKKEVGLPFYCLGSPITINEVKLRYLIDAGMQYFQMGIQTGSKQTKKEFCRPFTNEQILKAVHLLNKFKKDLPLPYYDFILDNPWENVDDQLETLHLILELPKPRRLFFSSLTYFPGTVLYDYAMREGLITDELKQVYVPHFGNLNGDYINFLIIIHAYYNVPRPIIRLLANRKLVSLMNREWLSRLYSLPFVLYIFSKRVSHISKGNIGKIFSVRRMTQKILSFIR